MEKEMKQMELNEEVLDAVNGGAVQLDSKTDKGIFEKFDPNEFGKSLNLVQE